MKKSAISILLAISMIASLVCVPAFADDVTVSDDHNHIVSDVQGEGHEQRAPDEGQEGGVSLDEAITPPVTLIDESDILAGEPEEIVYTTCIHGKTMGETCELCGELAHSSKNIPLIGYDQEFFDQANPDEDESWLLYTIRLVCFHGTADGVYCEKCSRVIDNGPTDLPMCTILDCCLHGHVKGEKCEACQELKEEQGDYELAEGEAWDDPLIYATDVMAFDSNVADMNGNGMLHCSWCGTALGDGINVDCHWDSSKGQYHWCTISRVEASGTCESHYVTWVYKCGVRISTNNSPYPCHHTGNCTWNTYKNWHNTILSAATCQSEGRLQKYYTNSCIHCGTESSAQGMTTEPVPKLSHIITGCAYIDSNTHQVECSGNGTSAHSFSEAHAFEQNGEDYRCTGCDAIKTTVHVDAYSTDGELIKGNLLTLLVEVGHDGPTTVSIQDYLDEIINAGHLCGMFPDDEQVDTAVVQSGGIHLKYYGFFDKTVPTVTAVLDNNIITIKAFDDLSGLKEVRYFGETFSIDTPLQYVGEDNPQFIYYSAKHIVNKGIYQITAVDYAGNTSTVDIEIDEEDAPSDKFSVYVPTSITFKVHKDGTVITTPEDLHIYNGNENRAVRITDVKVERNSDWQLVDFGTEFTDADLDSKKIALRINGVSVSVNGTVPINPEKWEIAADGQLALNLDIKVPKQTNDQFLNNVVKILFTTNWADAPIQGRYKIIFSNGDHGKVDSETGSVVLITDANGKLSEFPKAVPDLGYKFDHWEDDEGNIITAKTVFTNACIVCPIFVEKGDLIWEKGADLGNLTWGSMAYGNGMFIVTEGKYSSGSGNSYIFSKDGETQSSGKFPKNSRRFSVIYGNEKFVAVGYSSDTTFCSMDGKKWNEASLEESGWGDVTYGNGKFVAINSLSNKAAYSYDGVSWTITTLPTTTSTWEAVAFGDGKFVAIAYAENKVAYSSDGIAWNTASLPNRDARWKDITYGNGTFVVVGATKNPYGNYVSGKEVAYSTDGINWEMTSVPKDENWTLVTYGADMFIATEGTNWGRYIYSFDGINWKAGSTAIGNECYAICYGQDRFVAVIKSNSSGHKCFKYAVVE